jgi:hypothetical protein
MRNDVTWALDDLRQGSRLITSNIESALKFNSDVGVARSYEYDPHLNYILNLVRLWSERDVVSLLMDHFGRPGSATAAKQAPPYYLLQRDPLWCGLLLYSYRMKAHEAAIGISDSWSYILATAHFYNSLPQSQLLTCQWGDMERILSMHGSENLLVGSASTTFEACMKHYGLAVGMPASDFAPNQRRLPAASLHSKKRRLKQLAPVSRLFKGRHCDADGRNNLEPNDVIQVLRQKASDERIELYQMSSDVDVCEIIRTLGLAIEHETTQVTF